MIIVARKKGSFSAAAASCWESPSSSSQLQNRLTNISTTAKIRRTFFSTPALLASSLLLLLAAAPRGGLCFRFNKPPPSPPSSCCLSKTSQASVRGGPTATAATAATKMADNSNHIGVDVVVPAQNWDAVSGLEPATLWRQFAILSSLPRPSKKEGRVLDYIKKFAEDRNMKWRQDNAGNLVVFKPGGRNADPVIIQGHVDMVTEKNAENANHDFEKDPILLRRVSDGGGQWLKATGTTLGADNGIGVAAALALLDLDDAEESSDPMPPICALFTVDEETGLTGAMQMDADALGLTAGVAARTMLNLDTEEWGELYVGCAGGGESTISIPLRRDNAKKASSDSSTLAEIRVTGLVGGHSGINIHEGRANAVLICAAAASAAMSAADEADAKDDGGAGGVVRLVDIRGGDKHNAIPREASATLSLPSPDARAAVEGAVHKSFDGAKAEYGLLETSMRVEVVDCHSSSLPPPMTAEASRRLLAALLALPHGPIKFSHAMPDLVETSNNVASVSCDGNGGGGGEGDVATILCSTRSSVGEAMEAARDRIAAVVDLHGGGAAVRKSDPYPGWNPNMQSRVLKLARRLLKEKHLEGREPGVKAIHAGLECGLLIEKLGGNVDVVSFGPTIRGAHSPDERVQIDTVQPFYELVKDLLKELAK